MKKKRTPLQLHVSQLDFKLKDVAIFTDSLSAPPPVPFGNIIVPFCFHGSAMSSDVTGHIRDKTLCHRELDFSFSSFRAQGSSSDDLI